MLHFLEVLDEPGFAEVSRLAGEIWREHYPPIIGIEQVEYMLALIQSPEAVGRQVNQEGYCYFLVSPRASEPIGYLSIGEKPDALFLSKFYLKKECRGRGQAGEMMAFVEELARQVGRTRITLTTHKNNKVALRAYEKMGFQILEPVVTDIGGGYVMDDYRLEKRLSV